MQCSRLLVWPFQCRTCGRPMSSFWMLLSPLRASWCLRVGIRVLFLCQNLFRVLDLLGRIRLLFRSFLVVLCLSSSCRCCFTVGVVSPFSCCRIARSCFLVICFRIARICFLVERVALSCFFLVTFSYRRISFRFTGFLYQMLELIISSSFSSTNVI